VYTQNRRKEGGERGIVKKKKEAEPLSREYRNTTLCLLFESWLCNKAVKL